MAKASAEIRSAKRKMRHRGRLSQVPIYLSKLLRSFIYQNDWKLLPMAAIIAGLVSMVIRRDCFITMEGTLKGAFALTCVAIWNGCFNSIQSICRERNIVKREHRSGMHISAYIASHMLYQALLCIAQSIVTVVVCINVGVKFPSLGVFGYYSAFDIGLTIFFISYASDMLSLLVSSLVHSTTAAMTVMPFLLIFQLIFSGGFFSLPAWTEGITKFTISNYGLKCVAAQADYNHLPTVTAWNTLMKVQDQEVHGEIALGQILETAQDPDNPMAQKYRNIDLYEGLTVGDFVDMVAMHPDILARKDEKIDISFKIGDAIELIGEEKVKNALQNQMGAVSNNPDYDHDSVQVLSYWIRLFAFALFYSLIATVALEFIDKDHR